MDGQLNVVDFYMRDKSDNVTETTMAPITEEDESSGAEGSSLNYRKILLASATSLITLLIAVGG